MTFYSARWGKLKSLNNYVQDTLKKHGIKGYISNGEKQQKLMCIVIPNNYVDKISHDKPGVVQKKQYNIISTVINWDFNYNDKIIMEDKTYLMDYWDVVCYKEKPIYCNFLCSLERG